MRQQAQHWWEHLIAGIRLPLKPKHVDRLAEARRQRFKHIGRTASRRDSFRTFWRERDAEPLRGLPRRIRREMMRLAYKETK